MKKIQLDESITSKKFARNCKEGGKSHPVQFPRLFKGKSIKDPVVQNYCAKRNLPILTFDRKFLRDNFKKFVQQHPGIIIIALNRLRRNKVFITVRHAALILNRFKNDFPNWNNTSCYNSIIEITNETIEIWHIGDNEIEYDGIFNRKTNNWQRKIILILKQNAELSN